MSFQPIPVLLLENAAVKTICTHSGIQISICEAFSNVDTATKSYYRAVATFNRARSAEIAKALQNAPVDGPDYIRIVHAIALLDGKIRLPKTRTRTKK